MEESELAVKLYAYAFYSTAVAVAILGAVLGSYAGALLSGALMLLSALYFKSGHIINNLLVKRSKVIEIYNGYKLSGNLASLTKRRGPSYESISIATLRFDGVVDASTDVMRSLLESIREPFEFSFSAIQVDKKKLLDALDTKRRMKEISLSRLDAVKYDRANQMRREIQVIESEMDSIRKSGKAFDTRVRLKARATAESEAEAARQSLRSLERICDSFLAATKLGYDIVKGEELFAFGGEHL